MRHSTTFLLTLVFGTALGLGNATAQETAKDILSLFGNQIQNAKKARGTLFAKPKHRGLVMAPADGASAEEFEFDPVSEKDQVNIRIGFGFDSDVLTPDQAVKLDPLCTAMTELDAAKFRIIGHTDASGEGGYNDTLSLRRALSVKAFLNSDCGIGNDRLQAVGVGERYLMAEVDPDAADHRRVEFQALINAE